MMRVGLAGRRMQAAARLWVVMQRVVWVLRLRHHRRRREPRVAWKVIPLGLRVTVMMIGAWVGVRAKGKGRGRKARVGKGSCSQAKEQRLRLV